ncbi:hypothetical protein ACFFX0_31030 [Citricoccus parietis]|uniref:Secreted protein n=1 Tax=Citricoccus parietis TaxID=592307 RepID=A0ABV5G8S2_9MICC
MRPDHAFVGGIHLLVVVVVHVLPAFHYGDLLLLHLAHQIHEVMHLHFQHEQQTSPVTKLEVGAIEAEEIRKLRHREPEVRARIISSPYVVQFRAPPPGDRHGRQESHHIEPGGQQDHIHLVGSAVVGHDVVG